MKVTIGECQKAHRALRVLMTQQMNMGAAAKVRLLNNAIEPTAKSGDELVQGILQKHNEGKFLTPEHPKFAVAEEEATEALGVEVELSAKPIKRSDLWYRDPAGERQEISVAPLVLSDLGPFFDWELEDAPSEDGAVKTARKKARR